MKPQGQRVLAYCGHLGEDLAILAILGITYESITPPSVHLRKESPSSPQESKKQITVACGCIAAPGEQRVGADSEIQVAGTPLQR